MHKLLGWIKIDLVEIVLTQSLGAELGGSF